MSEHRRAVPVLDFLNRHEGLRRVIRTFVVAFLGILLPGSVGFLHGLTEWATSQGQSPFPDATSLGFLLVSAIVAGVIALVNAAVIWLENLTGKAVLRGQGRGVIKDV